MTRLPSLQCCFLASRLCRNILILGIVSPLCLIFWLHHIHRFFYFNFFLFFFFGCAHFGDLFSFGLRSCSLLKLNPPGPVLLDVIKSYITVNKEYLKKSCLKKTQALRQCILLCSTLKSFHKQFNSPIEQH